MAAWANNYGQLPVYELFFSIFGMRFSPDHMEREGVSKSQTFELRLCNAMIAV